MLAECWPSIRRGLDKPPQGQRPPQRQHKLDMSGDEDILHFLEVGTSRPEHPSTPDDLSACGAMDSGICPRWALQARG